MIISFVIALVAGIVLGLWFRVLALIPATVFALAAVIAGGHDSKMMAAVAALGTVVLLQIGYLIGCIVFFAARARLGGGAARGAPAHNGSCQLTL